MEAELDDFDALTTDEKRVFVTLFVNMRNRLEAALRIVEGSLRRQEEAFAAEIAGIVERTPIPSTAQLSGFTPAELALLKAATGAGAVEAERPVGVFRSWGRSLFKKGKARLSLTPSVAKCEFQCLLASTNIELTASTSPTTEQKTDRSSPLLSKLSSFVLHLFSFYIASQTTQLTISNDPPPLLPFPLIHFRPLSMSSCPKSECAIPNLSFSRAS